MASEHGHHVPGTPYRYKHGWVKLGAEVEHKDGSKGIVRDYAPYTQTVKVAWTSGKRSGFTGTTKAYHLIQGGTKGRTDSEIEQAGTAVRTVRQTPGRKHDWVKVGDQAVHRDGSSGTVLSYNPLTQTATIDWTAGKRRGSVGTTKAYHLDRQASIEQNDEKPFTFEEAEANHYLHWPEQDLQRDTVFVKVDPESARNARRELARRRAVWTKPPIEMSDRELQHEFMRLTQLQPGIDPEVQRRRVAEIDHEHYYRQGLRQYQENIRQLNELTDRDRSNLSLEELTGIRRGLSSNLGQATRSPHAESAFLAPASSTLEDVRQEIAKRLDQMSADQLEQKLNQLRESLQPGHAFGTDLHERQELANRIEVLLTHRRRAELIRDKSDQQVAEMMVAKDGWGRGERKRVVAEVARHLNHPEGLRTELSRWTVHPVEDADAVNDGKAFHGLAHYGPKRIDLNRDIFTPEANRGAVRAGPEGSGYFSHVGDGKDPRVSGVIAHEIGHAIHVVSVPGGSFDRSVQHHGLVFDNSGHSKTVQSVSEYGSKNHHEGAAESYAAHFFGQGSPIAQQLGRALISDARKDAGR